MTWPSRSSDVSTYELLVALGTAALLIVLVVSLVWAGTPKAAPGAGIEFARELWGVHRAKYDAVPEPRPYEYTRPAHKDLLRGTACIPLRYLFLNRAIPAIHSYSRSVSCEPGPWLGRAR